MSSRPDRREILRELARTLDPAAALERFPGLTRAGLARILKEAAEELGGEAPPKVHSSAKVSTSAKASAGRSAGGAERDAPSLFPAPAGESASLWVDGGARGNPGPAGAGAVLEVKGVPRRGRGEFLGEATNNVAEYRALLLGLRLAREAGVRSLTVHADSELMVRQMTGAYKVKNLELQKLHAEAKREAARFASVRYRHVPREENAEADRLVNRALDARGPVNLQHS